MTRESNSYKFKGLSLVKATILFCDFLFNSKFIFSFIVTILVLICGGLIRPFNFLHICDVSDEIPDSKEGMIKVARDERLYIGEGCIDFPSVIKRLPHLPFSIELPNAARIMHYGHEEHARRCLETAKQHLDHIETRPDHFCQDHAP